MPIGIVDKLIGIGETAADRLLPDRQAQDKFKREWRLALLEQDTRAMLGQIEANVEGAKHPSVWVAGWRPAAGWLCVAGIGYAMMLRPLFLWLWVIAEALFGGPWGCESATGCIQPPPQMSVSELFALLTALLGMGTLRQVDKDRGTDTKRLQ